MNTSNEIKSWASPTQVIKTNAAINISRACQILRAVMSTDKARACKLLNELLMLNRHILEDGRRPVSCYDKDIPTCEEKLGRHEKIKAKIAARLRDVVLSDVPIKQKELTQKLIKSLNLRQSTVWVMINKASRFGLLRKNEPDGLLVFIDPDLSKKQISTKN